MKIPITLYDLTRAYRKAKVDLFYSSVSRRRDLLVFEGDIRQNLDALLKKITSSEPFEFNEKDWTLYPASSPAPSDDQDLFSSDPWEAWQDSLKANTKKQFELRVMERLPIEFHILSALWIHQVGCYFDEKLSTSVYGNRLRRKKDSSALNLLSLGSFEHYLGPYSKWRNDGLKIMSDELEKGHRVTTITADASTYFHSLDPSFMLNEDFLSHMDVKLRDDQRELHNYFIQSLIAWKECTPLAQGLPVGLSASNVIANLALIQLDETINDDLVPLYYGRYVDDIILVLKAPKHRNKKQIWKWVQQRTNGLLSCTKGPNNHISFNPNNLEKSQTHFSNKKNKIFDLHGKSGLALLKKIEENLSDRSSEWRAMPDVPESASDVAADLIETISIKGEDVNALRHMDIVSIKRSRFSLKLRDYEAYARSVHPNDWADQRKAFLEAFCELIITPSAFLEFYQYLPRVLTLGIIHNNYDELKQILRGLGRTLQILKNDCTIDLKGEKKASYDIKTESLWAKWHDELIKQIRDTFLAASPNRALERLSSYFREDEKFEHEVLSGLLDDIFTFNFIFLAGPTNFGLMDLFGHDLANLPHRYAGLPGELRGHQKLPARHHTHQFIEDTEDFIPDQIKWGVQQLHRLLSIPEDKGLAMGFLFPTRPFHLHELQLIHHDPFEPSHSSTLSSILLSQRGYSIHPDQAAKRDGRRLTFHTSANNTAPKIAIASWLTKDESWVASICAKKDPDSHRFSRFCHLIDQIFKSPTKPDYFVLPELSLPPSWFVYLAMKLGKSGIALISGVEYIHSRNKPPADTKTSEDENEETTPEFAPDDNFFVKSHISHEVVHNQVWASLPQEGLGFPAISIYKQDKLQAAYHEDIDLENIANKKVIPQIAWKKPPIIQHGDFFFSILICSELTNIAHRAALRGEVDALIVPEWNKDTNTFTPRIESSALDVHAYIIQCNNRQFGDSRIRLPAKEPFDRDQIRIKGGDDDYIVIGEIDTKALREFQSNYRSPSKPFKPVPDGFKISEFRKTLPKA